MSWYKRRWVQLVAVFIIGAGIGGAGGSGGASDAEARADAAEALVAAAEQRATNAEAAAEKQLAALKAREAAVAAREKSVTAVEVEAKAGTFAGDGLYMVGSDIRAGTYKSAGGQNCYWARHDKANEILDNHLGAGPTLVVVRASDFSLEVNGCAEFRKV